jgi:hypothetical protein
MSSRRISAGTASQPGQWKVRAVHIGQGKLELAKRFDRREQFDPILIAHAVCPFLHRPERFRGRSGGINDRAHRNRGLALEPVKGAKIRHLIVSPRWVFLVPLP